MYPIYYKFGISPGMGNFAYATYYGISILCPKRYHIKLKVVKSISVLIDIIGLILFSMILLLALGV